VNHRIATGHRRADGGNILHIATVKFDALRRQIGIRPPTQHAHGVAAGEQWRNNRSAQESAAAGDENTHECGGGFRRRKSST
jgi:hypothetical protein